ncbi:MAG: heparinase II/III family protein [Alphaproteobacteria bacterium]|nr:heparinase II/III family protein [Alphaproteobacteria bacterium]
MDDLAPRSSWRARLTQAGLSGVLSGLLGARTPERFARPLPGPFPGDFAAGSALVAGTLSLGKNAVALPPPDWRAHESKELLETLNGFGWLADLVAAGANDRARALIADWIDRDTGWHETAWASDVLARRVAAWLTHAGLYADDDALRPRALQSLARQIRHLTRAATDVLAGPAQFDVMAALALGWAAGLAARRARAIVDTLLAAARSEQILADGGHVSRNPATQLQVLAALVLTRDALAAAGEDTAALVPTIAGLAAALRAFLHGDGRLALFNGADEGDPAVIAAVLARAGAAEAPPLSLRATGYERIEAGDTMLLIDTGAPPPPPFDRDAHAGALAFELGVGPERVIVNCGGAPQAEAAWRRAQRATAAHSTAVIDETNSAEIRAEGGFGRRPDSVVVERNSADGATWLTAAHDGYVAPFGLIHRRRLYVSAAGDDVRGEDIFEGRNECGFVLRFHLHPDVKASLMQTGSAALLRLPSGVAWRFQVAGAALDIEPSIYLGRPQVRRGEQLVAAGRPAGGATIKWALRRMTVK